MELNQIFGGFKSDSSFTVLQVRGPASPGAAHTRPPEAPRPRRRRGGARRVHRDPPVRRGHQRADPSQPGRLHPDHTQK